MFVALELDVFELLLRVDLLVVVVLASLICSLDGSHCFVVERVTSFAAVRRVLLSLVHLNIEALFQLPDLVTVLLSAHPHRGKLASFQEGAVVRMDSLPISQAFLFESLGVLEVTQNVAFHICQLVLALSERAQVFLLQLLNAVSVGVETLLDDVLLSLLEGLAVHLGHAFNKADDLLDLRPGVVGHVLAVFLGLLNVRVDVVSQRVHAELADLLVEALYVLGPFREFLRVDCVAVDFPLFVFKIKHSFLLEV